MVLASLVSGDTTAADWLFLIAAVVFGLLAIMHVVVKPLDVHGFLTCVAFCLLTVGWLVL